MLSWETRVEAQALQARGWTVTAIARHLGHDRKTIRAYLNGERTPGERKPSRPEAVGEFLEYCRQRLADDPHLWVTTLMDELVDLGYEGSYQALTAAVRRHGLRPVCTACAAAVKTADRAIIVHPAGAETQWDWLELPDPPAAWGCDGMAHLLLGTLPHSSRWRGWIAEREDQPHLIEGLHQVSLRLGGLTRGWRFDRMATVCHPASGRITAGFGPVAAHYQVSVSICPGYHPWRKGGVEKSADTIAQRWWRTVPDDATIGQAQAGLDRLYVRLDGRRRMVDGQATTVGVLADAEPLRPVPAPFGAQLHVQRVVSNQALISFRGNRYATPPGLTGQQVTVRHRLGTTTIDVLSAAGVLLARHPRQADGAGQTVRSEQQITAMTTTVLAAFAEQRPCRRKTRRPLSQAALDQADQIRNRRAGGVAAGDDVVVDLAAYAAQIRPLSGSAHASQDGEQR